MNIGSSIKQLRLRHGLTQQELATRCDLSKGFISQVESDQTSPSFATLVDLLEALGTTVRDFFSEPEPERIVFGPDDIFESADEAGVVTHWLVPNSQANDMEPILIDLPPRTATPEDAPHAGEEFGYVLAGSVRLVLGGVARRVKKGESFYFRATQPHQLTNPGTATARILWVATPPTF